MPWAHRVLKQHNGFKSQTGITGAHTGGPWGTLAQVEAARTAETPLTAKRLPLTTRRVESIVDGMATGRSGKDQGMAGQKIGRGDERKTKMCENSYAWEREIFWGWPTGSSPRAGKIMTRLDMRSGMATSMWRSADPSSLRPWLTRLQLPC